MEGNSAMPVSQFSYFNQLQCWHHHQFINFVCLDSQCKNGGAICAVCSFTQHKDHEVMPLKYYFVQISGGVSRSDHNLQICAQIDFRMSKIKRLLLEKVQNKLFCTEAIDHFNKYRSHVQGLITNELSIKQQLMSIVNSKKILTLNELNTIIHRYRIHEYEPENLRKQSAPSTKSEKKLSDLSNQEKFLFLKLEEIKQRSQQLEQQIKNGEPSLNELLSVFMIQESNGPSKVAYTFSSEFKHSAITITNEINAKQIHNYSSNIAMVTPVAESKKNSHQKKTIKFKIDKLMSWIGLGICYKEYVKNAVYYFNTDDVGHGCFLLTNDGYSWHNSDSSINSMVQNVTFQTGDVVMLTLDSKKKTLTFEKQDSSGKTYEMPYSPKADDQICFCVSLNSHDETVSIVQ